MATIITKRQAIDRLTQAIAQAHPDDLVEIHNELFPETPAPQDGAAEDPSALVKKIFAHINKGLEVQEILDLWNVIFPQHRRVRYDEDDGMIHYDERIEPVVQADF